MIETPVTVTFYLPLTLFTYFILFYINFQTDDNIPLRIMLLLMDEVFDLKSRNQWLRRRIVTLLRQIVRTMFGDIVNRRILDYVSFITSPKNVAHYLYLFK